MKRLTTPDAAAAYFRSYTPAQINAVVLRTFNAKMEQDPELFVEDEFDPDDFGFEEQCEAAWDAAERYLTATPSDWDKHKAEFLRTAWEKAVAFGMTSGLWGADADDFQNACGLVVCYELFRSVAHQIRETGEAK